MQNLTKMIPWRLSLTIVSRVGGGAGEETGRGCPGQAGGKCWAVTWHRVVHGHQEGATYFILFGREFEDFLTWRNDKCLR